ncbi:hypothetical protein CPB86DRAFT_862574 [Serendipita vermifera]|nr:hypothetical protein CPB86DRAFT_862574 [Serendipita vermifera]
MPLMLLHHLASTSALPTPERPYNGLSQRSYISCDDINECRKLTQIVWGCIATILIWTWVVLHPNIPPPVDNRHMDIREKYISRIRTVLRHRLLPFAVTLMAPEWTLAWAMQQWIAAKQIAQEGGPEWTMSHGFFVLMGGFHAFTRNGDEKGSQSGDHGTAWYPLDRTTVVKLVERGEVELPLQEEIQDRNKTTWLTKTLVVLQTSWFITQCATRAAAQLLLSELEVVTLAYVLVNGTIYIVWWDKPRNVNRPIRVFMPEKVVQQEHREEIGRTQSPDTWIDDVAADILPGTDSRHISPTFLAGRTSVPTFYAGRPNRHPEFLPSAILSPVMGILFGAIHCIAWSYPFPSHTEQLVWRLSSAIMIGVPAFIFTFYAALILADFLVKRYKERVSDIPKVVAGLAEVVLVCSRMSTFVLAFKGLASLPNGVFHTVPWTKWIPHI